MLINLLSFPVLSSNILIEFRMNRFQNLLFIINVAKTFLYFIINICK